MTLRKSDINKIATNIDQLRRYLEDNIGSSQKLRDRLLAVADGIADLVMELRTISKEMK